MPDAPWRKAEVLAATAGAPATGVVAQEERRIAIGAGIKVRPNGGQRLVRKEHDTFLVPLAGNQRLRRPAAVDVLTVQQRRFLAPHAGREQGVENGPVAQQLQAIPCALLALGERLLLRGHDDQRQRAVNARTYERSDRGVD